MKSVFMQNSSKISLIFGFGLLIFSLKTFSSDYRVQLQPTYSFSCYKSFLSTAEIWLRIRRYGWGLIAENDKLLKVDPTKDHNKHLADQIPMRIELVRKHYNLDQSFEEIQIMALDRPDMTKDAVNNLKNLRDYFNRLKEYAKQTFQNRIVTYKWWLPFSELLMSVEKDLNSLEQENLYFVRPKRLRAVTDTSMEQDFELILRELRDDIEDAFVEISDRLPRSLRDDPDMMRIWRNLAYLYKHSQLTIEAKGVTYVWWLRFEHLLANIEVLDYDGNYDFDFKSSNQPHYPYTACHPRTGRDPVIFLNPYCGKFAF